MASDTGGVKSFSIQGRLYRERERLNGMTDAERAWRKQWVKDQVLTHREPVYVAQIEKEMLNPIRRFYRWPLDTLFKPLEKTLGVNGCSIARYLTGKFFLGLFTVYAATYYFKYNAHDWTKKGGWRITANRPMIVPGDPGYPFTGAKHTPQDYADRGFKNSPI